MKGFDVDLPSLTAHDWDQAGKDAKYFGSLFRRMAVLETIAESVGGLKKAYENLPAEQAALTEEVASLRARLDEAAQKAADIVAAGQAEADGIVASAEAKLADVVRREGLAAELDEKISAKQAQVADEDQKLRRIREKIAEATKL